MKATLLTREFGKTLTIATRFVATRANLPILSNVIIKASKAKIEVLATDLEVSLSASLGAQVSDEGEIAAPAKALTEIISNLAFENVEIESVSENLKIRTEGFKSGLNAMNTADYPSVPQTTSSEALTLPANVFIPALTKVLFATSSDEARPALTGVLFLFHENEMVLVATDGFRLSQKRCPVKTHLSNKSLIIPKRVLSEIPRLGGSSDIMFDIKESEHSVVFGLPHFVLGSRVLEGEYPNYERILPKAPKVTVNVSKEDLTRAVKLASVFARDDANTIKMVIKEGELVISAQSSRMGQEEQSLVAKVEGEGMEISFNFRYIEEFLAVVAGESVLLKATDATTPCLFLDPKDETFLHLIMPVRI